MKSVNYKNCLQCCCTFESESLLFPLNFALQIFSSKYGCSYYCLLSFSLLVNRCDSLEEVDVDDGILGMLRETCNLKEVPEEVSYFAAVVVVAVLFSRALLDFKLR